MTPELTAMQRRLEKLEQDQARLLRHNQQMKWAMLVSFAATGVALALAFSGKGLVWANLQVSTVDAEVVRTQCLVVEERNANYDWKKARVLTDPEFMKLNFMKQRGAWLFVNDKETVLRLRDAKAKAVLRPSGETSTICKTGP